MFYDLMKQTRENKELTQKELSKKLGISRSTYAGWENGIDSISLSRLNDLCNYLDISIDYLCGISNSKNYHSKNKNKKTINPKIIGENLKKIRLKHKHTQAKTAEKIHTNQSNYSRYERGKNIIPTPVILDFSKHYNVSIDYLCGKKKDSNIN